SMKTEITSRNLQQTRILVERVSEKIDSISEDFIDRQIVEPILKEFGSIFNLLMTMKQTNEVDIDYLLEQFILVQKSFETEIIEPKDGASLNAIEHQPIKKLETQNIHQDKTINSTIRAGFKYNGRVIQRAQVAVYVYNSENS
ncbi:MAG: nucleotide exchange factor GrpE, partial [Paludibacter sp.]